MSPRLSLAVQNGDLLFPDGPILVLGPEADADLSALRRDAVRIVQPFRPAHDFWQSQGYAAAPETGQGPFAGVIVFLPRSKSAARGLIAQAMSLTDGHVVIDGAKTQGVDSLLKDMRRRTPVNGPIVKAHGKLFWVQAHSETFADWLPAATDADGFVTAPGVFSEGRVDPASAVLAAALPDKLGRNLADLGAGWGYLAAQVLTRPDVTTMHLVEADAVALDCARRNVTDDRARFHWADATTWQPPAPLDAIVMNPPFHAGRTGDPQIGREFIASAARMLDRNGTLWMVANRHLPYEAALSDAFRSVTELPGTPAFKLFRAERPSRPRR